MLGYISLFLVHFLSSCLCPCTFLRVEAVVELMVHHSNTFTAAVMIHWCHQYLTPFTGNLIESTWSQKAALLCKQNLRNVKNMTSGLYTSVAELTDSKNCPSKHSWPLNVKVYLWNFTATVKKNKKNNKMAVHKFMCQVGLEELMF